MTDDRTVKSLVFSEADRPLLDWLLDNCRGNFSGYVLDLLYQAKKAQTSPPVQGGDQGGGLDPDALAQALRPIIAQEIQRGLRSISLEQAAQPPPPPDDQDDLIAELTENLLGAF